MLVGIALFFMVLLALFFPKNKIVFLGIFIFMWILYGWSSENADYYIYMNRFNNFESLTMQTEPIFTFLMKFFNNLGFTYNQFLIFDSLIYIIIISIFVCKMTKYSNIVLALYMIFPFCFDIVMVRYSLGAAIVILGSRYLFSENKKDIFKYLICVLIGTLIHYSLILSIIFIIPKFIKRKNLIILVIIANFISLFFNKFIANIAFIFKNIKFLNIGNKVSIVLNFASSTYNSRTYTMYSLKMLILVIIALIVMYLIENYMKKFENTEKIVESVKFIQSVNVCILLLIPLLSFTADVFRLQITISLINYVFVGKYYDFEYQMIIEKKMNYTKGKITKAKVLITCCMLLYAISGLYLWILRTPNIHTVWLPFIRNNKIL